MSRNLPATLLVIDDDRLFCDAVRAFFAGNGMEIFCAHTMQEGKRFFVDKKMDVVLLDQKLPDGRGVDLCIPILAANDQTKIIFITAYPSFDNAVKAVRNGACDYLAKPVDTEELRLTVDKAFRTLELERVEQIHEYASRRDNAETVLIGAAGGLKEVQRMITLSAGSDAPALITGETGTGKNVVAKSIHYLQAGKKGAFVGINCAALPDNLIEAELFGYEKGAFTGAVVPRKGIFEMAEGGTLFLDEIGDLPLHLQSKLLGVLDEKKLKRLGGQSFRKVDVRILAATNINLEEAIRTKRFREDLYYRLSVLRIHIPPLRQRRDDIAGLCRHFLLKTARHPVPGLPPEEVRQMEEYHWPGNVRELRNIIERSVILQKDGIIYPSELLEAPRTPADRQTLQAARPPATLAEVERRYIRMVLQQMENNHSRTAKALGISRSTLLRKLKDHHLDTGEAFCDTVPN
jgi:DNA-binding NtrC family response regulator